MMGVDAHDPIHIIVDEDLSFELILAFIECVGMDPFPFVK